MLRVLHVSDTHLRRPGGVGDPDVPDVDPRERLETVLAAVERACDASGQPVRVVVHTGDVCDDGSRSGAGAVREILGRFGAPVLAVPGNHDLPGVIRDVFGPAELSLHGWRFLGVDSVISEEVHGQASEATAAVRQLRQGAAGIPTLLFMHHPLVSASTHRWFTLDGRAELIEELNAGGHDIAAVLSGHTHEVHDSSPEDMGVRLLGGPSTYYALQHKGEDWEYAGIAGCQLLDLADDGTVKATVITAG